MSRRSPGLNPVEGRRGFFLRGLSSLCPSLLRITDSTRASRHVRKMPVAEVTGESATSGQARDDHAASLLTLDLIRAADDAPSSDSPYPTSRTMRSFNG